MSTINIQDQIVSGCLSERKKGLKFYVNIFKRLLNASIHNAFIMYVSSSQRRNKMSMTPREFRYMLAESLVIEHRGIYPEISKPEGRPERLRRDVVHVPKYESGRTNPKRCCVCYQKRVDKKVHTQCVTCGVFLCFESCRAEWHSSAAIKVENSPGH